MSEGNAVARWLCRHKRTIIGGVVAVTSVGLSYYALDAQSQFTGTNAVTFSAIGVVVGLLIHYGDKIESIKSKYFEVKLKAAAEEAEKTVAETKQILESLRSTRRSMFKSAIHGIAYSNSRLAGIYADLRVDRFLDLIEDIKGQGAYEDVRAEIADGAWKLMEDQAQMAIEETTLYSESESNFFGFFQPLDLLRRADQERQRRQRELVGHDTAEVAIDTIIREVGRLFEVYEEANKKPQRVAGA